MQGGSIIDQLVYFNKQIQSQILNFWDSIDSISEPKKCNNNTRKYDKDERQDYQDNRYQYSRLHKNELIHGFELGD